LDHNGLGGRVKEKERKERNKRRGRGKDDKGKQHC
jgi:hypothetical protein